VTVIKQTHILDKTGDEIQRESF